MAYIRTKGKQLLLVHGIRNAETSAVEQQTLFTFYTRAEVEAALGQHQKLFRDLVELAQPTLRFDWPTIDETLKANLAHLPNSSPEKSNTAAIEFEQALVEFARVTWELNPYDLDSAAQLIQRHKLQLTLIGQRLQHLLQAKPRQVSEYSADTPSLWHQAARTRQLPLNGWEQLDELWDRGQYAQAEALAGLLVAAFPQFADGHNYQGLAAMERDDFAAALAHFQRAESVGRKQFPAKIAKSEYWSNHDTRPFLRALMHQVSVYNRMELYDKALEFCDRLQHRYAQDIFGEALRVPVLLNAGDWPQAARYALNLRIIYPENALLFALAAYQMGDLADAEAHFILAAQMQPSAAEILFGGRLPKGLPSDAHDHNNGVAMYRELKAYRRQHPKTMKFFKTLMNHARLQSAMLASDAAKRALRSDRSLDDAAFERVKTMETLDYAKMIAAQIHADGDRLAAESREFAERLG